MEQKVQEAQKKLEELEKSAPDKVDIKVNMSLTAEVSHQFYVSRHLGSISWGIRCALLLFDLRVK